MSRLVSLLIVLLAIAVATPVLAEDRLTLSGQLRVRGFHVDSLTFNDDISASNSFNQRLRLAGKISVAEGVSVNFRSDMSNKTWGTDSNNVQLQRAYMDIDKQMFNLKAGRMNYAIGNAIAIDTQGEGAVFTLKGAVPVEIGYFKGIERNPLNEDNDRDIYTLAVKHKTDMYNAVVFGGFLRDGLNQTDIYLAGMQTAMKLDPINLNFEINYFTGEDDVTGGADYKGLQAYLDANLAISETVTAGGSLFYAQGQSGTDRQVTNFTDDGSFMPETYSFMQLQFNLFPNTNRPFGSSALNTTFDPSGDGKGVIGAQVYGNFKVMDSLSLRANVGYWQMEEDYTSAEKATSTSAYDSFITVVGSARYAMAAKTNLDLVAAYTIPDAANNLTSDDEAMLLGVNLNVNF